MKLDHSVSTRYEVGKYQTLGGSIFQQGTVCTTATYDPYHMEEGGGDIGNYCSLRIYANLFCQATLVGNTTPVGIL